MLHAIILICALAGPCDRATATDIIIVPQAFAMPAVCQGDALAYLAATTIGRSMQGVTVRVLCERGRRAGR